jgi:hypothetical protein
MVAFTFKAKTEVLRGQYVEPSSREAFCIQADYSKVLRNGTFKNVAGLIVGLSEYIQLQPS